MILVKQQAHWCVYGFIVHNIAVQKSIREKARAYLQSTYDNYVTRPERFYKARVTVNLQCSSAGWTYQKSRTEMKPPLQNLVSRFRVICRSSASGMLCLGTMHGSLTNFLNCCSMSWLSPSSKSVIADTLNVGLDHCLRNSTGWPAAAEYCLWTAQYRKIETKRPCPLHLQPDMWMLFR